MPQGIAIVILAAGESTRMAQAKPLLEWQGLPLIQYQIRQALATDATAVVAVLGHRAKEVRTAMGPIDDSRLSVAVNSSYREGKTTSIKSGLRVLAEDCGGVALLAVDQPRPARVLSYLMERHTHGGHLISVPEHGGRDGHPPLFDATLFGELMTITEEGRGIREVMQRHKGHIAEVAIDDPIVLTNLNTPEDYERAKALAS